MWEPWSCTQWHLAGSDPGAPPLWAPPPHLWAGWSLKEETATLLGEMSWKSPFLTNRMGNFTRGSSQRNLLAWGNPRKDWASSPILQVVGSEAWDLGIALAAASFRRKIWMQPTKAHSILRWSPRRQMWALICTWPWENPWDSLPSDFSSMKWIILPYAFHNWQSPVWKSDEVNTDLWKRSVTPSTL